MKRKQVTSILIAAAMTASLGVSPVAAAAPDSTETQEVLSESGDSASLDPAEDTSSEETEPAISEEMDLALEATAEAPSEHHISTDHVRVEDTYTKRYLFAVREGSAIPSSDSGLSYLMKNTYMADSKEQIYRAYSGDQILYIEENSEIELLDDDTPNDRYYGKQQEYLDSVSAQALWDDSIDVTDVTIAIIDSGLYSSHADLNQDHILTGYNYINNNEDTTDSAGHGTQVAGVIAAARNNRIGVAGLLDQVNILPLRISKDDSSSPTIAAAANAINEAVDKYHVQVINMSIGQKAESETLKAAAQYAAQKNVIMIAAAGNTGNKANDILYPAGYEEVIGVGAVDNQSRVRENSQKNQSVFVTAPGENIYTLDVNNRYSYKSGTSYSAPFVAAMAAAAKSVNPNLTIAEFKQLLQETSTDAGDEGYDTTYGYGIINIQRFVNRLLNREDEIAQVVNDGTPFAIQYEKTYGSTLSDSFLATAPTNDGGLVAVGYTFGDSTDPKWEYHLASEKAPNSTNDALMVKFNADAQVEWAKAFGTSGVDVFDDVAVLTDGTIVAVGRSPYTFGTKKSTVSGYLVRVQPNDPEQYEEIHLGGSTGGDYVEGVTATRDGGYAIVGRTSSYDSRDWKKVHQATTTADGFLAKYQADGIQTFSTTYSNAPKESRATRFHDIAEDGDGNLIVVGEATLAKHLQNAVIVKFDGSTGGTLWSRSEGTTQTSAPKNSTEGHTSLYESVAVLSDGSIVTTGTTKTSGSNTAEKNWGIEGEKDGIVVHYTADGIVKSAVNIGTASGTVDLSGITNTPDGGYLVYGQTSNEIYRSDLYTWKIKGATDTVVLKYDANDRQEWNESYGVKNRGEWMNDLFIRENGEIVIVGETNRNSSDGLIDASIWTTAAHAENQNPKEPTEEPVEEPQEETRYLDGTYTGSGTGFNTDVPVIVSVTIKDGKIADVSYVSSGDTSSYMNKAKVLLNTVKEEQRSDVDAITGATYSSRGLKQAVVNALRQAEKNSSNVPTEEDPEDNGTTDPVTPDVNSVPTPTPTPTAAPTDRTSDQTENRLTMYRLYNPNSGEHFYTSSTEERDNVVKAGWNNEGTAWFSPKKTDQPVYRLYNPNAGDHHYTTSLEEMSHLSSVGWKYEGIAWYSASKADGIAIYRLYNPNATGAGAHHFTPNEAERDTLVKAGWKDEGTAWYGLK